MTIATIQLRERNSFIIMVQITGTLVIAMALIPYLYSTTVELVSYRPRDNNGIQIPETTMAVAITVEFGSQPIALMELPESNLHIPIVALSVTLGIVICTQVVSPFFMKVIATIELQE
jgi:hypothetical protein